MTHWTRWLLGGSVSPPRREQRGHEPSRNAGWEALRAVLEIAPVAVTIWAPDGTIALWSRGGERIFGWHRAEVEGGHSPFAAAEHAAEEASLRHRILAGNEISALPLRRRDRQGRLHELLLDAGPLRADDGSIVGGISVWREVTELRHSEPGGAAHRDASAAAGGAEQLRDARLAPEPARADAPSAKLLSRISHDLRQPLLALGLLAGALERRSRDSDSRELVGDLAGIVRSLQSTFENITEWTRLESGLVGVAPTSFPAAEVMQAVAEEFAAEAARRGLDLRVVPSRAVIACDRASLQRILRHLVENALKFTARGKVLLGARRRGSMLRVIVADAGHGIPESRQDEIFDAYCQLDAGREAGGLGLGLAIVRRLAELSHLGVGVRSVPGKGSRLWVDVPLADAPAQ